MKTFVLKLSYYEDLITAQNPEGYKYVQAETMAVSEGLILFHKDGKLVLGVKVADILYFVEA